ncbi:MAG: two-component sensor histidine kinase [Dactylosporangium sp.]|nr:two-component sensor histidine kinase [Dactylosporangium sp.]
MIDRPNVVPRLVVLLAVAVGYLTLFQAGSRSPWLDWGFALAAVAIGLLGGILPLFTAVAQAALLLVADLFGTFEHGPAAFVKYLAVYALFELAVRRPWPSVAVDMIVLAAVYTRHTGTDLPGALPSLLYRIAITVAVPVLLGAYIRATRTLAGQTRQRAEEERRHHAARIQAATIAERTAIARELHDLVAHHVSAMVLRVGVARHVAAGGDPRVAEVLDDLHVSGTAALADLRRLVAVMRDPAQAPHDAEVPIVEPGGLPAALAAVAERYRTIGVTVETSVDPELVRLDQLRARTVLRLVQEGLANVARHAGPSAHARLSAHVADSGEARLRIVDDGGRRDSASPASTAATAGEGFGLIGMRERVERLGGRFRAGPVDVGWELTAELPTGFPADGTHPEDARP